jgi:seryl-tRNA synthetase
MLDLYYIRQNPEIIRQTLINRQRDPSLLDQLLPLEEQRRQLIGHIDQVRSQQNQLGREIKGKPTPDQLTLGAKYKETLKELESQLKPLDDTVTGLLEQIPNIPSPDTPIGKDDTDNPVIKTWGNPPQFNFPALDHVDLGEKLDLIDLKGAAKVSGSRFGYFKNQAAVLEMAVMFYAFQKLASRGWTGMIPPAMVRQDTEWKMGYTSNKNLENAYYLFPEDELIFISSSEHAVVPYHMDEVIDPARLPLKYVNFSPCFRRESGTYGKDTRGMFRVHFFNKVEMNVFTLPDTNISDAMCLEMRSLEEELMQELGIPYQIVAACTGDLPQPNRRMFDINAWFPGQNTYRETQSCSNCTDYQARRLNTKTKVDGKNEFVHILNATLITDRAVLAILENHQQPDGSVLIPQVLWPYTGFQTISPQS